jgi:hypothetical protein
MKYLFALISCLSLTSSFAQNTKDEKHIVFSADKKLSWCDKDSLERFTPTAMEVDSVDAYLRRRFNELLRAERKQDFENYYKQYAGQLQNGQRIVYVLGSCIKLPTAEEDILNVRGSNQCFFEARINLSKRKLQSFQFNN